MYQITSASNERIKALIRLRSRRYRDSSGLFLVEGPRLVERALRTGLQPIEVFVDGSTALEVSLDPVTVEPTVLDRASYRQRSEGVIAVFEQFPTGWDRLDPGPNPLFLAAESIEKPGNLGAMLRTADAVGADGLVSVDPEVDPFNPNVVRSSTGALFGVPLTVGTLDELVSLLAERSIPLVAATPDATETLWEIDLTGPCAIIVGSEDTGLSDEAQSAAQQHFSIPMSGLADSLNAAVTLALAAYEAVRQRST